MTASILDYSRMDWPTNWAAVFGRQAPLLLELGFGGGDYLVELARTNPSANVIGIEISLPSLRRGVSKIAISGLTNACVLQGDSRAALWLLFAPRTVSGVTINFPDPWPKTHHHHRRLINDRFLHLLATRMIEGAPLDIATDHPGYAEVIEQVLDQSPYFTSRDSRPFLWNIADRPRTKYERIGLAEGRPPRYFLWQRGEVAAPDPFHSPEEKIVPHVVIQSGMGLDQIGQRFTPFHVEEAGLHIKFLNMYRALTADALLVEVFISEEPYHQRVGLAIRRRREGDYVIGMHELGFPRPTRGIHVAIGQLLAWLRALDPQLTLVNSTLMGADGAGESPL